MGDVFSSHKKTATKKAPKGDSKSDAKSAASSPAVTASGSDPNTATPPPAADGAGAQTIASAKPSYAAVAAKWVTAASAVPNADAKTDAKSAPSNDAPSSDAQSGAVTAQSASTAAATSDAKTGVSKSDRKSAADSKQAKKPCDTRAARHRIKLALLRGHPKLDKRMSILANVFQSVGNDLAMNYLDTIEHLADLMEKERANCALEERRVLLWLYAKYVVRTDNPKVRELAAAGRWGHDSIATLVAAMRNDEESRTMFATLCAHVPDVTALPNLDQAAFEWLRSAAVLAPEAKIQLAKDVYDKLWSERAYSGQSLYRDRALMRHYDRCVLTKGGQDTVFHILAARVLTYVESRHRFIIAYGTTATIYVPWEFPVCEVGFELMFGKSKMIMITKIAGGYSFVLSRLLAMSLKASVGFAKFVEISAKIGGEIAKGLELTVPKSESTLFLAALLCGSLPSGIDAMFATARVLTGVSGDFELGLEVGITLKKLLPIPEPPKVAALELVKEKTEVDVIPTAIDTAEAAIMAKLPKLAELLSMKFEFKASVELGWQKLESADGKTVATRRVGSGVKMAANISLLANCEIGLGYMRETDESMGADGKTAISATRHVFSIQTSNADVGRAIRDWILARSGCCVAPPSGSKADSKADSKVSAEATAAAPAPATASDNDETTDRWIIIKLKDEVGTKSVTCYREVLYDHSHNNLSLVFFKLTRPNVFRVSIPVKVVDLPVPAKPAKS